MNAIEIRGLKKSFRGMYALIGIGSYFILEKTSLV